MLRRSRPFTIRRPHSKPKRRRPLLLPMRRLLPLQHRLRHQRRSDPPSFTLRLSRRRPHHPARMATQLPRRSCRLPLNRRRLRAQPRWPARRRPRNSPQHRTPARPPVRRAAAAAVHRVRHCVQPRQDCRIVRAQRGLVCRHAAGPVRAAGTSAVRVQWRRRHRRSVAHQFVRQVVVRHVPPVPGPQVRALRRALAATRVVAVARRASAARSTRPRLTPISRRP